ncbi:MAG: ATP synthase F1 subunit delta [Bacteroidota bacterium]|nr:ATP synthase F1 subunit delta [Bacteroidota bacterium]
MAYYRVIKRYATALLEDAKERKNLEIVFANANLFLKVVTENRELAVLLKNPTIQSQKKYVILKKIFKDNFEKITIDFIKIVVDNKRETLIVDIFESFTSLYRTEKGILEAEVVSVIKLEKNILEDIKSYIKRTSNCKDVNLSNTIDSSLIGGFSLKYDNMLLNASIENRIKNLEKHLLKD